ncbi:mechanosensitive ion channel family protein [Rhizobium grahamii]|uniref:Mechanosensitive ion channel family protein n=1 Tax=Rhizobium grahamii TaxID=1120045 RepID=A0A5Q0C6W5_9HYPH|nr:MULTISPECIES: mechanosensitive ion channel family protein [Rhizobium]QFY61232.1 mechanosensitive ion channel family protein [Rhizobium grahamii]QRM49618.1 mechanosensitive ion channel family protein [Rhizobium sp. BG6]
MADTFYQRAVLRFCLLVATLAITASASAQTVAPAADQAPPAEVRQMLQLMQTPQAKQWMATQMQAAPSTEAPASSDQMSVLSTFFGHARHHLDMVSGAAMGLPDEVENASALVERDIEPTGWSWVGIEVLVLLLAGPVVELLFRMVVPKPRIRRPDGEVTTVAHHAAANLIYRIVPAIVFVAATFIALAAINWPPLTQSMAIAVAIALIVARLTISLGRLLVALVTLPKPDGERQVSRATALFWFRRSAVFVIYFAFGWVVIQMLARLGFSAGSRYLAAYALGIGLFLIATEAVWSRPAENRHKSATVSWSLTVYFLLLWGLWVAGFNLLLWIGIYLLLLPRALSVATLAVRSLHQAEAGFLAKRRIATVLLDRGVRALIIAAAAMWLGRILGFAADRMAAGETIVDRIVRGSIGGIVILLAADLLWHLARAYINGRLDDAPLEGAINDEDRAKRARLQTLLPIFRNILAVVIAVIAVLMVLSGLGIEIGPLIAGAGVVGVAVGFGAQTIVKDVISGMFYLWDDAFRVGEYIESGSHKGVVEAFSLRSVRLRHHRGPLTTVPFGELGAVRNLNRDWTIDKITLNVTYDTDLVKAKKVIKQIGQQLLDNPDYSPHIIETLKMKGVEQFGEFAIQIRLAMMTKPGEQFVIRRNALAMIRNAFKENGIEFAVPTVQVSGEGRDSEARAAAARFASQHSDPGQASA